MSTLTTKRNPAQRSLVKMFDQDNPSKRSKVDSESDNQSSSSLMNVKIPNEHDKTAYISSSSSNTSSSNQDTSSSSSDDLSS